MTQSQLTLKKSIIMIKKNKALSHMTKTPKIRTKKIIYMNKFVFLC